MKHKLIELNNSLINEMNNTLIPDEHSENLFINSAHKGANNFNLLVNELCKSNNIKILDIGCGSGELLSKLQTLNPTLELHGITTSKNEVIYARHSGLENIYLIDMRNVAEYYESNYFDIIIIWCSFHYISKEEQNNVINQIYDLLKPNGYFLNVADLDYQICYPNSSKFEYTDKYLSCSTQGRIYTYRKI